MTTQTERVAEVLHARHKAFKVQPPCEECVWSAQALANAGLLAAPVDGDLREALVDALVMTRVSDFAGTDLDVMEETADQLLPLIAAHVAEEKRKAAERAWDEGALPYQNQLVQMGEDVAEHLNPYSKGGEA